jgi:hypothetical protein
MASSDMFGAMRFLVIVLATGCAFKNPGASPDGGGATGDGGNSHIDAPDGPCMLGPLDMTVATLTGCANAGVTDGPRGTAHFSNPVNVVLGPSGLAYVADFDSGLLRRIDTDGTTTTIVSSPTFQRPFGMVLGTDGMLYVETDDDDLGAHSQVTGTLWSVNPATGAPTVIIRDHGRPRGLVLAPGPILYTCDYVHMIIESLDLSQLGATPQLVAGTMDVEGHIQSDGTAPSTFAQPWDLVMDSDGDLIVTEFDNNVLRKVTPNPGDQAIVTDFAGTGAPGHVDGPLATAQFNQPKGIAMDSTGALYVSEAGNHDVRKIYNGMVTTVAGDGAAGYVDNTDPTMAELYGVEGLAVSPDGTRIVVADGNDGDMMPFNHVRVITEP